VKNRLLALLVAALTLPLLPGCGGGGDDDSGTSHLRLVNATTDYASLDLYTDDTRVTAGVAQDSVGTYASITSGTYTVRLKRADSSTTSLAVSRSLTKDSNNTLVAYSTGGTLRTLNFTDAETAPTSGTAKLRLFNTSTEAGTLDVYLTDVGGSLTDVSATASSIASEQFSAYNEISKGSYRLVVTGAGDKTDVRLDIPSLALADQQIATLVVTTTPGGVLVNGLLLNQASTVTAQKNASARMRLVADTTASGVVGATVNGVTLSSGLKSPSVGSYALVPAGPLATTLTVNGATVSTSGLVAEAGADLTLMVAGTPAAAQVVLLSDDNRPPASTANAKIRLVHGVNTLSGSMTLTADYSAVANDVLFATASTSAGVPASTTYRLEATSASTTAQLYLATDVTLQATRVYTVFMLGDATTPVGVLRRDR
jgi:hypothetical protein